MGYRGGENYQLVVDTLKRLYGDDRVIGEALQGELINLPMVDDSVDALQQFVETVERVCQQLTLLRHPENNPMVTQLIKSKLPSTILTELVMMERVDGHQWTVAELRKGLSEVVSIRAEVLRCTRASSMLDSSWNASYGFQPHNDQPWDRTMELERSYTTKQGSGRPGNQGPGGIPCCFFCDEPHLAAECENVVDKQTRVQILNDLGRCLNCLRMDHSSDQCRRRGCQCGELHHRSLCNEADEPQQQHYDDTGEAYDRTVAAVTLAPMAGTDRVISMALHARVFIEMEPDHRIKALLFFDPGSQITLIRSSLARLLGATMQRNDQLDVFSFMARNPTRINAPMLTVLIEQTNGTSMELITHQTDFILNSVRCARMDTDHLVMTDAEPDLLIGAGDFWRFFQRSERIDEQLYRIHTSVGPVLCGRDLSPMMVCASPLLRISGTLLPDGPFTDGQQQLTRSEKHCVYRGDWLMTTLLRLAHCRALTWTCLLLLIFALCCVFWPMNSAERTADVTAEKLEMRAQRAHLRVCCRKTSVLQSCRLMVPRDLTFFATGGPLPAHSDDIGMSNRLVSDSAVALAFPMQPAAVLPFPDNVAFPATSTIAAWVLISAPDRTVDDSTATLAFPELCSVPAQLHAMVTHPLRSAGNSAAANVIFAAWLVSNSARGNGISLSSEDDDERGSHGTPISEDDVQSSQLSEVEKEQPGEAGGRTLRSRKRKTEVQQLMSAAEEPMAKALRRHGELRRTIRERNATIRRLTDENNALRTRAQQAERMLASQPCSSSRGATAPVTDASCLQEALCKSRAQLGMPVLSPSGVSPRMATSPSALGPSPHRQPAPPYFARLFAGSPVTRRRNLAPSPPPAFRAPGRTLALPLHDSSLAPSAHAPLSCLPGPSQRVLDPSPPALLRDARDPSPGCARLRPWP